MGKRFLDSTGLSTVFGLIKTALAGKQDTISVLPVNKGGTGRTALTGNTSLRNDLGLGTGNGALAVANGGTGCTTLNSGDLLVGAGTGSITTIAKTATNVGGAVVVRDANGDFQGRNITANGAFSGSLSGNASTATALNISAKVGDTNKPVYFKADGTPAACTSLALNTSGKADTAGTADKLVTSTGDSTTPVYFSGGVPTNCSKYAGGTKVNLNGSNKGAGDATIYSVTTAGTKGEVCTSNGSGAPVWRQRVTFSNSTPSSTSGYYVGDIWIVY